MSRTEVQQELIKKSLSFFKMKKRGLLDITMRTGKTVCTLKLLKDMKYTQKKILIAYADSRIKNGWISDQEKFDITLGDVTYTNFSSLKKYTEDKWDFFICDEPQDLSENEYGYTQSIVENSKYCLFLTGTVTSVLEERLMEMDVGTIAKYSKDQAIKDGIVADYKVTIHRVNLDNVKRTKNKKGKMVTEKNTWDAYTAVIEKLKKEKKDISFLTIHRNRLSQNSIAKRNKILQLLKDLKDKRVLVFTGLIKQSEGLGIPFFHSKCKDESAIWEFNQGEFNHLALANAGKVGATYENLDSIILSNFVGNDASNRQLLDRCAKLDYADKISDMHIICLNEPSEIKKLMKTLDKLDQTKIKWI